MKELVQEFKLKIYLMIKISLTGNFSSMIFGSSLSIIRKVLQKIQKEKG